MSEMRDALQVTKFSAGYRDEVASHSELLECIEGGTAWTSKMLATLRGNTQRVHREIKGLIFELKVMSWIASRNGAHRIRYEPVGTDHAGKRIDLMVEGPTASWLIELKTFHPEDLETTIPHEHIPSNITVYMDKETYHGEDAVRTNLIDEVIDAEAKARNYPKGPVRVLGVLCDSHL